MQTFIFHLAIDEFFLSIERSLDRAIKDGPAVVAPTFSDRSLIWETSKRAREFGIKEMMPLSVAKKLCGELKVVHPRIDLYQKVQKDLEKKFLHKWTPHFEIVSPGKFHLDMSGTEKIFGSFQQSAGALLKELRHNLSFFAFLGAGRNKLVSQIASSDLQSRSLQKKKISRMAKEGQALVVGVGEEENFLDPLPVYRLPLVHQLTLRKGIKNQDETNFLRDLNIHSIKDLRQLTPVGLKVLFGENWRNAHLQSRGIDFDPIKKRDERDLISAEYFLEKPSNNLTFLYHRLHLLVEDCFLQWQKMNVELSQGKIFCRYEDFKTFEESFFLQESYFSLEDLLKFFREGFHKGLRRRTALVTVKVEFVAAMGTGKQLSFFPQMESQQSLDILNLVEKTKNRFGDKGLFCGREDATYHEVS